MYAYNLIGIDMKSYLKYVFFPTQRGPHLACHMVQSGLQDDSNKAFQFRPSNGKSLGTHAISS